MLLLSNAVGVGRQISAGWKHISLLPLRVSMLNVLQCGRGRCHLRSLILLLRSSVGTEVDLI